jgi:hypothetical protein
LSSEACCPLVTFSSCLIKRHVKLPMPTKVDRGHQASGIGIFRRPVSHRLVDPGEPCLTAGSSLQDQQLIQAARSQATSMRCNAKCCLSSTCITQLTAWVWASHGWRRLYDAPSQCPNEQYGGQLRRLQAQNTRGPEPAAQLKPWHRVRSSAPRTLQQANAVQEAFFCSSCAALRSRRPADHWELHHACPRPWT